MLELLEPHSVANGGPLQIERVSFTEGRSNLIVNYPCAVGEMEAGSEPSLAFVGAHMASTRNPLTRMNKTSEEY